MSQIENQESDVLTDHAYDGIQEYDNPTPGWWTYTFIATVIFGVIYWFVSVMSGGGLGAERALMLARAEDAELQRRVIGDLKPDTATILASLNDATRLTIGAGIYTQNCQSCHSKGGIGGTGPNLTDNAYIHVKDIDDIVDVIVNGRNLGAMPAQRAKLTPTDIALVSAYVASLKGTNAPGGKPAEGNVVQAWNAQ